MCPGDIKITERIENWTISIIQYTLYMPAYYHLFFYMYSLT